MGDFVPPQILLGKSIIKDIDIKPDLLTSPGRELTIHVTIAKSLGGSKTKNR